MNCKNNKKIRIGLVIDYLSSEYSENLVTSIQSYCKDKDIELLIYTMGELHDDHSQYGYQNISVTSLISSNNIDGVIMTPGTQMHILTADEFGEYLKYYKDLPLVNVSATIKGYPSVVGDTRKAFEEMLQYILDTQHCQKIGFVDVDNNSPDVELRRQVLKQVLKKNHIPLENVQFWKANFEYGSTYSCLLNYLKANNYVFNVDTIIALNDDMAYACIDFVRNHLHKRIPEDIIVTGFDDLQRASFSNPSLTSINQQVGLQGVVAAESLIKLIKGRKIPELKKIESTVSIRESTDRIPVKKDYFNSKKYLKNSQITQEMLHDKLSVAEWYTRRSQIYTAARFYSEMDANVLYDTLPQLLTEELQNFGFSSAMVVLYDEPVEMEKPFDYFELPDKAKLIAGFDYNAGYNIRKTNKVITFNPREKLVPEECINYYPAGSIVSSLFYKTVQYGYLVIGCGNYDLNVYNLISRSLGSQIHNCYEYTKIMQEQFSIKNQYNKLDFLAHTDELTGLKNRRGFMEFGRALLNLSEAMGQTGLVVFSDMDGLKKINDTYGHDEGDIAIKAQSKILAEAFRSNDIVSRLAGDEFAVISPGLTESLFQTIKDNVDRACIEWTSENKKPYRLSVSLGTASYPDGIKGYDLTYLLSQADLSLYKEKRRKKNQK